MDRRSGAKSQKRLITRVALVAMLLLVQAVWAESRLEMDATAIKGSRELPKVLYIVPWKSTRLGALSPGIGSSTFDTQWEALDRDVFRRQVSYYGTLFGEKEQK